MKDQNDQGVPGAEPPVGLSAVVLAEDGSGLLAPIPHAPTHEANTDEQLEEVAIGVAGQIADATGKPHGVVLERIYERAKDDAVEIFRWLRWNGYVILRRNSVSPCCHATIDEDAHCVQCRNYVDVTQEVPRVSDQKGATKERSHSDATEAKRTPDERGAHSDEQTPNQPEEPSEQGLAP